MALCFRAETERVEKRAEECVERSAIGRPQSVTVGAQQEHARNETQANAAFADAANEVTPAKIELASWIDVFQMLLASMVVFETSEGAHWANDGISRQCVPADRCEDRQGRARSWQTGLTKFGRKSPVKLIKVRFTSWRDRSVASRSPAIQQQLDAWAKRVSALSAAVAHIREQEVNANIEALQKSLARIAADVQKIDDERALLLSAEETAAEAEERAASKHEKTGTFGYQVLNDAGTHVTKIVDEAGNDLPVQAVYSYEVVDDHPQLPVWAKIRQTRH